MVFMTSDRQRFISVMLLLTAFLSYSISLYSSLPVKNYTTSKIPEPGKSAWQKYNCNACHQVYGLGGYLGPDLTNVYSIKGGAYIEAFLKTGTTIMPNYNLTEQEIIDLMSFLKNIDSTGRSDPKTFTLNYDGTIYQ